MGLTAASLQKSHTHRRGPDRLVTLIFAAHDTTRYQLTNAMVTVAEHHDQWALLARRPELTEQAVEEVMRWCPATSSVQRFSAEDFEYKGLRIAQNKPIVMCIIVAQRDPRVFENAGSFDISVARQAPVLQFGGGPHYCLGAALARTELSEALPVLTSRLGPPQSQVCVKIALCIAW